MKPTHLTTPSGVTGTYAWLIRELAHHPSRFTAVDVEFLFNNQPKLQPRFSFILQCRAAGIQDRLPDAIVDTLITGTPFDVDGETYYYGEFLLQKK